MEFEMFSCGGCRTCEMACSFKHAGEFIPSISSIRILDKKSNLGFIVSLVEESDGQNMACDGCKEIEVPLCVQYCEKSEDLKHILKELMKISKKIERQETNP